MNRRRLVFFLTKHYYEKYSPERKKRLTKTSTVCTEDTDRKQQDRKINCF